MDPDNQRPTVQPQGSQQRPRLTLGPPITWPTQVHLRALVAPSVATAISVALDGSQDTVEAAGGKGVAAPEIAHNRTTAPKTPAAKAVPASQTTASWETDSQQTCLSEGVHSVVASAADPDIRAAVRALGSLQFRSVFKHVLWKSSPYTHGMSESAAVALCFDVLECTGYMEGAAHYAGPWRFPGVPLVEWTAGIAYVARSQIDVDAPVECATNMIVTPEGTTMVTARGYYGIVNVPHGIHEDGRGTLDVLSEISYAFVLLLNVVRVLGLRSREEVEAFVRARAPGSRLLTASEEDMVIARGRRPPGNFRVPAGHITWLCDAHAFIERETALRDPLLL